MKRTLYRYHEIECQQKLFFPNNLLHGLRILSSNHIFFGNTISCFTFKSSILWEYHFVFYLQIIYSLGIQFRVLPSNHLFFGNTISCFTLKSSILWAYNFVFSFKIIYSLGIQFRVFLWNHLFFGNTISCFLLKWFSSTQFVDFNPSNKETSTSV